MDDDCCTICAGTTEGQLTTLECGHTFHIHCALQWFRYHNSTCPNCRSDVCNQVWTRKTPGQRVSAMKRRKNLPSHVQRLVKQLDRARQQYNSARCEQREFLSTHADVLRKRSKLTTRVRHSKKRVHELTRTIDTVGNQAAHLAFHGFWNQTEPSDNESDNESDVE